MNPELREQLSDGVGTAAVGSDDTPRVRVVPIAEGDTTTGLSGETTYWGRDTLKSAVESGALDGAKIIKGQSGRGHKDSVGEQAAPEDILGRVDEWSYEEGVGPVGESVMVDEQMAARIEHGLLEISPDFYRRLGDYDESLGAKPATQILDMPYITVLDRGSGANASIEPAMAEALGYNPTGENHLAEQLAVSTHQVSYSGTTEASWDGLTQGDFDDDADLSEIADHFLVSQSGFPPSSYGDLALEVVSADGDLNVNALESAYNLAPQVSDITDDEATDVRGMILSLADEEWGDSHDVGPSDEDSGTEEQNAEFVRSDDGGRNPTSSTDDNTEPTIEDMSNDNQNPDPELREQLAKSQTRVSDLEETKEQLAEKNSDLEEQLTEVQDERDTLENERDDLDDKAEQLSEDFGPIKEAIAELAAGDSALTGEQLASKFSGSEIIDMLADEEDDRTPAEQVQEQLAAGVEPRGGSESEDDPADEPTEEQLAQADELAFEVLNGRDIQQMGTEQLSPREFVKERKGVDPAQCDNAEQLRARVAAEGGD